MTKFDVKDILLEALMYKTYARDWWQTRNEWIIIIPVLGSPTLKPDWTLKFGNELVEDRTLVNFLNNKFHIWFDFYDYDEPNVLKENIVMYLQGCERYIFKPTKTSHATAWIKPFPVRKKISPYNERKLMGNSVNGEAEEAQPL